jgi:hypothetical protein
MRDKQAEIREELKQDSERHSPYKIGVRTESVRSRIANVKRAILMMFLRN